MVTIQDIGLQLTKPVKELAEWNFPFSQTLEKYCSLFNSTCNKSFGEAGLVVQNSTAVYAHRVDSLWNRTDYFRNIFSNYEHEESKNPSKKRDRKTDMCFQDFKIVNFAEEVDKNIDIKKITHDTIKPKNCHFTQLEKGISQHVSIDIYDVNGEVISKKYDFQCNQNINMDGILVDEFAPQDFCCSGNNSAQNSLLTSLNYSHELLCNTLASNSIIHDDNNESTNSDTESERNHDTSQEQEISNLVTSLESTQQNLSLSMNTNTDNTLIKTPTNISNDNCHDLTFTNISNETCSNTPDDTTSPITNIDSTILLNNNDTDDKCLNNNIRQSIDVCSLLDTPPESVNSKGGRTSSTDDPVLLSDTNEDLTKIKIVTDTVQNTSDISTRNKMRLRSTSRSTPKSFKRKLLTSYKRGRNLTKKVLTSILKKPNSSPKSRPNMFKKNLSTCIKYIREYDPLQYDDVTNTESDFLGFRLRVTESDININDNVTTTSIDEEISEIHSPSPTGMSPSHENFCDVWFRSDSPHFLPENVDKWHELMQPKLREAEQRSTFCIRDYASRIMDTLKTSGQQKISFDAIIREERPCEVARYFLASLDLASRQNVDISADKNIAQNIEISLYKEDGQCSRNGQADSHD